MKGVIVSCLVDLVTTRYGRDKWQDSLERAGLDRSTIVLATSDVDDVTVMNVLFAVAVELGLTMEQLAEAFGEHWVCHFAARTYKPLYRKTAREMLLALDGIHVDATRSTPGARPPRFGYEWQDERHLVMTYSSSRGLIDLLVGLVHGVAKYYGVELEVERLDERHLRITFPP